MNPENVIKTGIAIVAIALCILVVVKPTVNNDHHVKYVDSLVAMDALSGSLIRNHLLVRHGHISHYDFLEADLQKMERFAKLSTITPYHAGDSFKRQAVSLSEEYLSVLSQVRDNVELSKRGIGLLKNSRSLIDLALKKINEEQIDTGDSSETMTTMPLLLGLNQTFRDGSDFKGFQRLLDQLAAASIIDSHVIAQIQLHAEILEKFAAPIQKASNELYTLTEKLQQPRAIRNAYLENHNAVLATTAMLLWISYALATLLILLAITLSIVAGRARKETSKAMQQTEAAREITERKVVETRNAVLHCNDLLEKIGNGDFSDRIEHCFADELEDLRLGVNQAADSVQFTMKELHRVMGHMQRGDFTTQLDERVTGDFRQQVEQTNQRLRSIMHSICTVMDDMRQGDFSSRIDIALEGSFNELKESVNDSMSSLGRSIAEIVGMVEEQAQGDFTRQLGGNWPGELGSLSVALNGTADTVHAMVVDIQRLSVQVTQMSLSVLENSEQLKTQSERQAEAIDVAMHASRNVSELIEKNRQSTQKATTLTYQSHQQAGDCRGISENSVASMQLVTNKIAEITSITDTLETLASKTNLLALNAAVEASRAGESGKGFSVVAGEVKALARMSADASNSIGEIVRDTEKQVKDGSVAANKASHALDAIEVSVQNVGEINHNIAVASEKQSHEINAMTVKVDEAYDLIKTNKDMASYTHTTSMELEELARQMSQLVAFFKDESYCNDEQNEAA